MYLQHSFSDGNLCNPLWAFLNCSTTQYNAPWMKLCGLISICLFFAISDEIRAKVKGFEKGVFVVIITTSIIMAWALIIYGNSAEKGGTMKIRWITIWTVYFNIAAAGLHLCIEAKTKQKIQGCFCSSNFIFTKPDFGRLISSYLRSFPLSIRLRFDSVLDQKRPVYLCTANRYESYFRALASSGEPENKRWQR